MTSLNADRVLSLKGFTARDREQFRRLNEALRPASAAFLLKAVIKNPKLLTQWPSTIAANAKTSALVLGIDETAFIKLAGTQPALLFLRPESLQEKVVTGAEAFHIPQAAFITMCLKRPSLLTMTTARIASNAKEVARLLGADVNAMASVFLKRPALLTLNPASIAANVQASAAALGLTRDQFIRCGYAQPQLFYMKPSTLAVNAKESADALGVQGDVFKLAALRQPTLFYRSPLTLGAKGDLIREFLNSVGHDGSFEDFIIRYPSGLTYAAAHIRARMLVRALRLCTSNAAALISMPTRKVDALLVAHYRSAGPLLESERTIRALVEQGIIKNPRADRAKSHRRPQSRHRRSAV